MRQMLLPLCIVCSWPAFALTSPALASAACPRGPDDAAARELARTAQTTAEVYGIDHSGFYAGLSPQRLRRVEPSIEISAAEARRDGGDAYVSQALAIEHGGGYIVRARTFDGHVYSVLRTRFGSVTRSARLCGRFESW